MCWSCSIIVSVVCVKLVVFYGCDDGGPSDFVTYGRFGVVPTLPLFSKLWLVLGCFDLTFSSMCLAIFWPRALWCLLYGSGPRYVKGR